MTKMAKRKSLGANLLQITYHEWNSLKCDKNFSFNKAQPVFISMQMKKENVGILLIHKEG